MSSCECSNPLDYRITSENAGADYLYLRCDECGGKAGRIDIDMDAFADTITNPENLDPRDPEVAEKTTEHGSPTVSLHLLDVDTPFMHRDN